MTTDIDNATLARMVNRQQIWDCMLRYIRGADRMDQDLIRSAFWPDAHNTHGGVSGSVEDFIAGWHPAQATRDISFHMVSNQSVEFEGDTLAHVETYFMAAIHIKDDTQIEMVGGRYADLFEKRGGEWRVKTRLVMLDWQGMADASQMKERLATRHQGSRDRNDPSYERPIRPRPALAVGGWVSAGDNKSKEKADG